MSPNEPRGWRALFRRRSGEVLADPIDPTSRFEHRDIDPKMVALTGAGVFIGMWVAVMLVYPLFGFFRHISTEPGPPTSVPPQTGFVAPPAPTLQQSPRRDLQEYLAQQNAELSGYKMVDPAAGVVTIPIARAIQLIAQRGIPPQPDPHNMTYFDPRVGTRMTGFEGKVEPEPR